MTECLFCKIAQKEINAYFIKENKSFLSFLDIYPHSPGHTLVIPKDHYDDFKNLPEDLGNDLIKIIKETIFLLSKALKTNDFTLGINEGKLAGQAILHFHLHIIPRFENDNGGSIHTVVFNQPKESLVDIYQKIKNES